MRGRTLMALATAALFLTACAAQENGPDVASVSDTGTKPAASASATTDRNEQAIKYATCLREQGLDIPDPGPDGRMQMKFGPESGGQEKVQKAMDACKQFQPQGMTSGKGGDPQQAENMRKQAQCMRDNGVEAFPDPEGGMMRITPEVGEDPDFKAAQEKCRMNLGGGQGGS
ncbi:MAG: hypothetical protein HOV96_17375 [Nonomuraea sp.]|nr:hypothetical protein [Nonomuraea sp.]NUP79311.1 hypothetical protein [Nonomuraea sp.]NUS08643.1 hypothetical protein [Nonomuraea sp.]